VSLMSVPMFTYAVNQHATRPIAYGRVFRAILAGTIPARMIGTKWFADADAAPAAAEMLSSLYYPGKANGAYASAAAKRARRAAREAEAV